MQDNLPVFGKLQEIFIVQSDVYFSVQIYSTLWFDEHFHAYVVKATSTEVIIRSNGILTHGTLHFRAVTGLTKANTKAVVLKHHISSD